MRKLYIFGIHQLWGRLLRKHTTILGKIVLATLIIMPVYGGDAEAVPLYATDGGFRGLYLLETDMVSATYIGVDGQKDYVSPEIELDFSGDGYIYASDVTLKNKLYKMDPSSGGTVNEITLDFSSFNYLSAPVITAMEFVGQDLYAAFAN